MPARVPKHGFLLPMFANKPSPIPTLHLDDEQEQLDASLESFVRGMDQIHADPHLSQQGRAVKVTALLESTRKQLTTLRQHGRGDTEVAARAKAARSLPMTFPTGASPRRR